MRFAHLADCHIGSWRDPKLKDISTKAFIKAVAICMQKKIDFMLIAGDLFNTALPSIDLLKDVVEKLKELNDAGIPVYMIAGSHDFSPSGKTMLEIIEKAGLIINVAKGEAVGDQLRLRFTIDKKTGAKITGMLGKKGGLEKEFYKSLSKKEIEHEQGYKIFMFHSLLTEFKPEELKDVDSHPLSLLPKHCTYYAGGHPHFIMQREEKDFGIIAYPGPLFPNNFAELEKLERGGFYLVQADEIEIEGKKDILTSIKWEPVQIFNVFKIHINANHKSPEQVEEDIREKTKGKELNNTIVTLRIEGVLSSGRPSDINFKEVFERLYSKSAYFVMKNTAKLQSKEFEEVKVDISSVDDIEERIIKEHLQKIRVNNLNADKEAHLTRDMMQTFSQEKLEGETNSTFEERIKADIKKILDL